MRTLAPIALALLFTAPLCVGAEIYSWKDASGKTVYSDKPPLEKRVITREVKSGRTSGGEVSPAPAAAAKPAEGGASGGEAAKTASKSPDQVKAEADARQQLCGNARKRLVQLESEKGILITKNDKGESTPLVGDAKKAEVESARKDVDQWCK